MAEESDRKLITPLIFSDEPIGQGEERRSAEWLPRVPRLRISAMQMLFCGAF